MDIAVRRVGTVLGMTSAETIEERPYVLYMFKGGENVLYTRPPHNRCMRST